MLSLIDCLIDMVLEIIAQAVFAFVTATPDVVIDIDDTVLFSTTRYSTTSSSRYLIVAANVLSYKYSTGLRFIIYVAPGSLYSSRCAVCALCWLQELIFRLEGFRPYGMYLTLIQFALYSGFSFTERSLSGHYERK